MQNIITLKEFISLKHFDYENKLLVYPTDTVYGIGGDPFDILAVQRLFHLKRRVLKPFPVLISSKESAYNLAHVGELAEFFMNHFWPGKLTILLNKRIDVPAILGSQYIGLRIPGDENIIKLIKKMGGYIIGTSANISGMPPAISCDEAYKYFGDEIDLYICGDYILNRIPSTVVLIDESKRSVLIYREGAINKSKIYKYCRELGCNAKVQGL